MELILTLGRPPNALYKWALRTEEIRPELPKIGQNQSFLGRWTKII